LDKRYHIANYKDNLEVEIYINANANELRSFTSEECMTAAIILSQYAFYLQKLVNDEQALHTYLQEKLNNTIASVLHNYRGSLEERRSSAIYGNKQTIELHKIIVGVTIHIQKLSFLSARIEQLAKMYNSLHFTKGHKNA